MGAGPYEELQPEELLRQAKPDEREDHGIGVMDLVQIGPVSAAVVLGRIAADKISKGMDGAQKAASNAVSHVLGWY